MFDFFDILLEARGDKKAIPKPTKNTDYSKGIDNTLKDNNNIADKTTDVTTEDNNDNKQEPTDYTSEDVTKNPTNDGDDKDDTGTTDDDSTPTDYTDSDNNDTSDDVDNGDEPTDYTDNTDTDDDTSSEDNDTSDDGDGTTESPDKDKNANLLNDFIEFYYLIQNTIKKISDLDKSDIMMNKVLNRVISNLGKMETLVYNFITYKFSDNTYINNLYQYNYFIEAFFGTSCAGNCFCAF